MKKILFAFLISLALPVAVMAQNATMVAMAQAELNKRGLNEGEVRTRLLESGIDIDRISPADYASYQDRVISILDQMQAEKNAQATAEAPIAGSASANEPTTAASMVQTASETPQSTVGETAAEAALEQALVENNVSPTAGNDIYGHSLFTGKNLEVFRTTDGAQAPDSYVLGEGDEVHISIFGSSQTEIHQRIGADGSIQPAGSTKIFLKGMTLAQGRTAIQNKLSQFFSFRPDQIAVTITTARTVSVGIYGEVGVQGGFTISALNTAFNALAAAGGPTDMGSVRNVQLSRSGKNYRLDLYKYMTNPTAGVKYDIQNGDVIFVPIAQKVVGIEGAVNRPMRYELVDGESMLDLIGYAGGLTASAHPDFVQVERFENGSKKYLEYNLKDVLSGRSKVALEQGDVVRIRTGNEPLDQYVAISGDVYYEGNYDLAKNRSLIALLENAKPRYTARTEYVYVERTRPDETVEVLTVPWPGLKGNPDFELEARDAVRVLDQASFRDVETISVNGQVRAPFTRTFGMNDRMTVAQAIEYADGLKPSVFPVAYIFRRDLTNADKMEYIRINLDTDGETLLQPGDQLNIYDNTRYTNVGEVNVSGAVKEPFGTAYDPSLTVHDLLSMAGGFAVGAAFDKVEVFRVNLSNTEAVKMDLITLKVDEEYNVIGEDFQLQPFDHIVVRLTPNFTMGRSVEINGRVKYPGTYVLTDSKMQLSSVIEMAGGLLDDADPFARLFRTYNNRGNIGLDLRKVKQNKGSLKEDPILMEGDVINIVRQENTVTIRETGTRLAQYIPDNFSATQKLIVYKGGHSAKWYINHYAGGFQKTADRNSVTVTMPNNQTIGTTRFLGIRKYPTVEPGGVITMRMDDQKREKLDKPKEKIDWGAEMRSTLSALTSVVSIYLLIDRLK